MTVGPNLTPAERLRAAMVFAEATTAEARAAVTATAGATGDTFAPQPPVFNKGREGKSRLPQGWEPRVEFAKDGSGRADKIVSPPIPEDIPEAEALAMTLEMLNAMVPAGFRARIAEVRMHTAAWHRDYDPEVKAGVGEAYTKPSRLYKWVVEPIPDSEMVVAGMHEEDWNAAIKRIEKMKFRPKAPVLDPQAVDYFLPHGDLQAGQGDGDSVDGLIARMSMFAVIAKADTDRLKKCGTKVRRIVTPSLGDLVEGLLAGSFYGNSEWLVNLHSRDQRKVARRLIQRMIEELALLGFPILVPVVPGNHGENRRSTGKLVSDPSDNSDLEVMEVIAEIFRHNPVLKDQVEFIFPEGHNQTLTIDLGWGYGVGFTHGHLSGHAGGHPAQKMTNWLKSQALAEQPIGRAKYIVSGHFHSAMYVTIPGDKTWIQIPASCDRSAHFTETAGLSGGPALVSWTMGPNGIANWTEHTLPTLASIEGELAVAREALAAQAEYRASKKARKVA